MHEGPPGAALPPLPHSSAPGPDHGSPAQVPPNGRRCRTRKLLSRATRSPSFASQTTQHSSRVEQAQRYVTVRSLSKDNATNSAFFLGLTFCLQNSKFSKWGRGDSNPDLRRAKAALYFSEPFWSLQNSCKSAYFLYSALPKFSGCLLRLLHGCCTALFAWEALYTQPWPTEVWVIVPVFVVRLGADDNHKVLQSTLSPSCTSSRKLP